MKHRDLSAVACPVARGLEHVGEWWSILILREAFNGATKFDEFQKGVEGIAPNMLTRRLKDLVEKGILARRRYSARPERYEYVLTESGLDFYKVMWALAEWGNRHFAPEGELIQLRNKKTKKKAVPVLIDRNTGAEMRLQDYRVVAGPGAPPGLREKMAAVKEPA